MQDMLVPIFGDNGAIIVQYAITLVVIVALIALVVWGMRRYGNSAIRPAARGRLPRLAIVDTLPVDNKRKLVLLRRDNVEHLLLIGGPSDVVVESSIVRQRVGQRPGQATAPRSGASATPQGGGAAQPASAAPEAAAVAVRSHEAAAAAGTASGEADTGATSTIHFPVRRAGTHAGIDRIASSRRERAAVHASSTHAAEPARSYRAHATPVADSESSPTTVQREPLTTRPDFAAARAERTPDSRPEPASRFAPAAATGATEPLDGPVPGYEPATEDHDAANAFAPHRPRTEPTNDSGPAESEPNAEEAEVAAATPAASGEPQEDTATDETVGDLEQEMARLLDQISTTRRE